MNFKEGDIIYEKGDVIKVFADDGTKTIYKKLNNYKEYSNDDYANKPRAPISYRQAIIDGIPYTFNTVKYSNIKVDKK